MQSPKQSHRYHFEDLKEGMEASTETIITQEDTRTFAKLSGDTNPVHTDPDEAAKSQFKAPIAHGLLTASLFSALFGKELPGPGSIYVSQSLVFKRPVYLGDSVTATIKIVRIDTERRRVFFQTVCKTRGRIAISGEAEIYVPALSG